MDGTCPYNPQTAPLIEARSDEYGDFKLGKIHLPKENKYHKDYDHKRFVLRIDHRCNQYGMIQTKCIVLPEIIIDDMRYKTWESTTTIIPLLQGDDEVN